MQLFLERALIPPVIHELRTFFQHMIDAPSDTVQPHLNLAALALCKTDTPQAAPKSPQIDAGQSKDLGSIEGAPVFGPTPAPTVEGEASNADLADSVMGDDGRDASTQVNTQADAPPPPSRPPPIPPRPAPPAKSKLGNIEESARQQDAAEVLSNIFDLLSCAIKCDQVVREGEQWDLIKNMFFSDVTTVRKTQPNPEKSEEFRDHFLVSPGWRDRNIYATLDDDFGQSELDDGVVKYDYIDKPAPVQIINLRRLQFDRAKGEQVYDRSHISLESILHLDRYLGKTLSLPPNELLKLREAQWEKQKRLRILDESRAKLRDTDIDGLDAPDIIDETSTWLKELEQEHGQQGGYALPTPPPELADTLAEKAIQIRHELEQIDSQMTQLETEVNTIFSEARDWPYRLHAVFTHRGGTKGGHYWIYIFDFQNGMWRKYNDDLVDAVDENEVLGQVTGATPSASTGVVYIREDLINTMTEAVKREPKAVEEESRTNGDVAMRDIDDDELPGLEPIAYKEMPVIEGVETA